MDASRQMCCWQCLQGPNSPRHAGSPLANGASCAHSPGNFSGTDSDLDVPLALRRRSASLRQGSTHRPAGPSKLEARRSFLQPAAASSKDLADHLSGLDTAEPSGLGSANLSGLDPGDHSGLESLTHRSATPSEMGSELSQGHGGPARLHPLAAPDEGPGPNLSPAQDLDMGGLTAEDLAAFAAEDIIVPISERVKRVKRKAPMPTYTSMLEAPLPIKKKKKKRLLQHSVGPAVARTGAGSSSHPAATSTMPAAYGHPLAGQGHPQEHLPAAHIQANGHLPPAARPASEWDVHISGGCRSIVWPN